MEERSKFNVSSDKRQRSFGGIVFDSAAEMRYYRDVLFPQICRGEIVRCELQKKYILQPSFRRQGRAVPAIEYKADFYVAFADGTERVIDVKGFADPVAKLKRKMFWYTYPQIEYIWIGYSKADGGWVSYEKIQSGRRERKKQKTGKGER